MKNLQKPEAFVFIAKGCKYTCISVATLDKLRSLEMGIYLANESLDEWGYNAEDIQEDLHILGVDYKEYRYRDEASLNTKQLQDLIHFYLSLKDPNYHDEVPRFI